MLRVRVCFNLLNQRTVQTQSQMTEPETDCFHDQEKEVRVLSGEQGGRGDASEETGTIYAAS